MDKIWQDEDLMLFWQSDFVEDEFEILDQLTADLDKEGINDDIIVLDAVNYIYCPNVFKCINGDKYESLLGLHVGLLTMKDVDYFYHNSMRNMKNHNDFADFLERQGEIKLADDLRKVHSRALTAYKIGQLIRHKRIRKERLTWVRT